MNLTDGYLIVLPREQAKPFFGYRDDQARLDFLTELLEGSEAKRLSLEGRWQNLHDALSSLPEEHAVLQQCILGGRSLNQGNRHHVCLIRPDVVGLIAEQGEQVEESQLGSDPWQLAQGVFHHYREAAATGSAMVFVAATS